MFRGFLMELIEDIDYEQVEEALAEDECETCAAELQGVICGLLTAGLSPQKSGWQITLAEMLNQGQDFSLQSKSSIDTVFAWTHQQMSQVDSLAPTLLPDDSYPVIDQLEALSKWCQGFLLGFGLQNGEKTIESQDVVESLNDIVEISQLNLETDENEENQTALFTLIEHIKVAVQVIYLEMVVKNSPSAPLNAPLDQPLH